MLAICAIIAGVLGLAVGSFLNVVIHRVPAGKSLVSPPSACPECGHAIRWYDNVPVVSWLVLRGRCRDCGAPISVRYPLIELATGIAFVLVTLYVFLLYPVIEPVEITTPSGAPVISTGSITVSGLLVLAAYLWFVAAGIALTAIDLEVRRLPSPIVYSTLVGMVLLLAAAAAVSADLGRIVTALLAGAAFLVFYLLVLLIAPRGGMGRGDVRLAPVIGVATGWVGWDAAGVGWFAAFLLGGLVGIGLILARRAGRRTAIPFGPWMLAGAWIGIVAGPWAWQLYARTLGLA